MVMYDTAIAYWKPIDFPNQRKPALRVEISGCLYKLCDGKYVTNRLKFSSIKGTYAVLHEPKV